MLMNHEVRFSVYEHRLVDSDQNIIRCSFIVLKDEDGDILLWTDFHRYARGGRKVMVRNVYSDDDKKLRNIVKLSLQTATTSTWNTWLAGSMRRITER